MALINVEVFGCSKQKEVYLVEGLVTAKSNVEIECCFCTQWTIREIDPLLKPLWELDDIMEGLRLQIFAHVLIDNEMMNTFCHELEKILYKSPYGKWDDIADKNLELFLANHSEIAIFSKVPCDIMYMWMNPKILGIKRNKYAKMQNKPKKVEILPFDFEIIGLGADIKEFAELLSRDLGLKKKDEGIYKISWDTTNEVEGYGNLLQSKLDKETCLKLMPFKLSNWTFTSRQSEADFNDKPKIFILKHAMYTLGFEGLKCLLAESNTARAIVLYEKMNYELYRILHFFKKHHQVFLVHCPDMSNTHHWLRSFEATYNILKGLLDKKQNQPYFEDAFWLKIWENRLLEVQSEKKAFARESKLSNASKMYDKEKKIVKLRDMYQS